VAILAVTAELVQWQNVLVVTPTASAKVLHTWARDRKRPGQNLHAPRFLVNITRRMQWGMDRKAGLSYAQWPIRLVVIGFRQGQGERERALHSEINALEVRRIGDET
jgi:hypothetical protein